MNKFTGKPASPGIAIGHVIFIPSKRPELKRSITAPDAEVERYLDAVDQAMKELEELELHSTEPLGKENAALFSVHKMMLEDDEFRENVLTVIQNDRLCAEYAIDQASANIAAIFSEMDDEYMKARAADILDISDRLIRILSGRQSSPALSDTPAIYAAADFFPSQVASFRHDSVLGIICTGGSQTSHAAIFARALRIPAVFEIGSDLADLAGHTVIVDGTTGILIADPDTETLTQYQS